MKDVHNLPEGLRIVVNFDRQHAAIGEATGLLAGVCGQLATDCVAFSISIDKWSDIPESFLKINGIFFSKLDFASKCVIAWPNDFYSNRLTKNGGNIG